MLGQVFARECKVRSAGIAGSGPFTNQICQWRGLNVLKHFFFMATFSLLLCVISSPFTNLLIYLCIIVVILAVYCEYCLSVWLIFLQIEVQMLVLVIGEEQ